MSQCWKNTKKKNCGETPRDLSKWKSSCSNCKECENLNDNVIELEERRN